MPLIPLDVHEDHFIHTDQILEAKLDETADHPSRTVLRMWVKGEPNPREFFDRHAERIMAAIRKANKRGHSPTP